MDRLLFEPPLLRRGENKQRCWASMTRSGVNIAMNGDLTRAVAEVTGTDVETPENVGFTGGQPQQNPLGQAGNLIDRPGPGETVDISSEPGQTQVLDFDPSEVNLLVEGDNLILLFEDGSQIVFEQPVELVQLGLNWGNTWR